MSLWKRFVKTIRNGLGDEIYLPIRRFLFSIYDGGKAFLYFVQIRKDTSRVNRYILCLNRKKKNAKCRVIFVTSPLSTYWGNIKSVYEAATENNNIEPLVLIPPTKINGEWECKRNELINSSGVNCINSVENSKLVAIESLHPDYLFYEHPYMSVLPPKYHPRETSRFSRICYIPYGSDSTGAGIVKSAYNDDFFRNVYAFFSAGDFSAKYCRKNFLLWGCRRRRIVSIGYPRFDCFTRMNKTDSRYNVMWIPRWTVAGGINSYDDLTTRTSFFEFKDKILERCRGQKDENWIIRPHPQAFGNYVFEGRMTEEEVNKYKESIYDLDNAELDNKADYVDSFNIADLLLADYSSIVPVFLATKKPIIYFGDVDAFISDGLKQSIYNVSSWDEAGSVIDRLKNGIDPLKAVRESEGQKLLEKNMDVGRKIIDFLYKDYFS